MDLTSLSIALAAGVLAAFNPCGFALLPTYLAMFLGDETRRGADGGEQNQRGSVGRALIVGASVTGGFVLVFALVGALVAAFSVSLGNYLPLLTAASGVLLVVAGVWLFTGRELSAKLPRANLAVSGSWRGMTAYGIVYATVSLSCTLPVFLAPVVSVFSTGGGVGAGVAVLLAYAFGMGAVLTTLAVLMTLFNESVVNRIRKITPYLGRISGGFRAVAGVYITYCAWVGFQSFQGIIIDSGPVAWITDASGAVGQFVSQSGVWHVVGGLFFVLIASTLVLRRRRTGSSPAVADRIPRRPQSARIGCRIQPSTCSIQSSQN